MDRVDIIQLELSSRASRGFILAENKEERERAENCLGCCTELSKNYFSQRNHKVWYKENQITRLSVLRNADSQK